MKKILFHLLVFTFYLAIHGQNNNELLISVIDTNGQPLPGAPVKLMHVTDSTTMHQITDFNGIAKFQNLDNGLYIINISYLGFKPIETTLKITDVSRKYEFIMSADAISLGGITITAKKPLIRQEDDKTIIDPEPIANTSTNALEILESTPGLYVDQDGGIFVAGTSPATIYINGREQRMSNQDINTLLRSLPPGSVERIEILRTPSTKYDASSSGGIINIVLKKGVKIGRFGSINTGFNQGIMGNRFIGFSFNNSGNNSTSYININYNFNQRLDEINSVRFLNIDTELHQNAESKIRNNQPYMGYGWTYDKKKIGFSYDGRVSGGFRNTGSENDNTVLNASHELQAQSRNIIDNELVFLNIQQDGGIKLKIDTLGSELDVKLSYNYQNSNTEQQYLTLYNSPINTSFAGSGNNKQNRHFVMFQADYIQQLPQKIKLESGFKSSFQYFDSDAIFYLILNDNYISDTQRNNKYSYSEQIHALYAQASRALFWGFHLKMGCRMEYTNMSGMQKIPNDTGFVVKHTKWFPYVFLSKKVLDIMGIELFGYAIYRRTISRPGYQEMNPAVRFVDQFLYETGNPSLKPQMNENLELNISFNDIPVFAIGQNRTTDIFSMVTYTDNQNPNVLVRTYDNLGKSTENYFRAMAGIPPGGKYFFALGAQYNMNEYTGTYNNQPLNFSRGSWRFFTFHSLNIFKETKITASGFMMTNGVWNFYELKNFGQLNIGISQTFLNKKLTITLNARDILKTMVNEFVLNQGEIYSYGTRYTDNRRFGINIRYNFGISKKSDRKKMFEFSDEEQTE